MYTIHDKILKKAYEYSPLSLGMSFNIKTGEELQLYKNAARELYRLDLIDFEQDSKITITPLGKKIFISSDIASFIDDLDKKENRKERKEIIDFTLSKWKVWTFWPLFIIAILGGLYSIYDFIRTPNIEGNVKELQQTIIKMELEQSKLQTLILDQKNDSLSTLSNDGLKK
jgi:hypothetical protein